MSYNLPGFDESMKFSLDYKSKKQEDKWDILISRYNDFRADDYIEDNIPKIIHQVWVGSAMPELESVYTYNVRERLPSDWTYKLWDNDNIYELKYIDIDLYNKLGKTKNGIAKQADLIRYAALLEFGGVYIDTDFILHTDFNRFLGLDSFIGIAYDQEPTMFNGLIGCVPKSKFIESLLVLDRPIQGDVMDVTGPWFVTRRLFESFNSENVVAFPCSFFYPFPNFQRSRSLGDDYTSYIQDESVCTHMWSSSWM